MKSPRLFLSGLAAVAIATLGLLPAAAAPDISPTDLMCPSSNQLVMGEFLMDAPDPNKPAAEAAAGNADKAKKPDADTKTVAKANSSTKDKVAKTKTAKAKKPAPPDQTAAADDGASKQFEFQLQRLMMMAGGKAFRKVPG